VTLAPPITVSVPTEPLRLPTRITALDGLRGFAIGLVLAYHYVQLNLPVDQPWARVVGRVFPLAWSGVDLFFVLSGFLIGGVLIDHRDSPRLGRVFYARRSLRILPLYYGTLAVLVFRLHVGNYALVPLWMYVTFTANLGMAQISSWDTSSLSVIWSLAIEEQFYLFAPLLVRGLAPARLPWALLSLVVLSWACRVGVRTFDPTGFSSHLLTPCRMDGFGFGMLAAWAVRSPAARAALARWFPRWWLPIALPVPLLVALNVVDAKIGDWHLPLYGYTALGLFFAALVYTVVVAQPRRLAAALSWAPLVSLGRLSFFIYLWHMIVFQSLRRHYVGDVDIVLDSPAKGAFVLTCVAVTWGLAWLSWRLFEGPLVRLGQRYAY
jgi:peptidoglycan/LPS O-acetylase OafA/YrhL